MSEQRFTLGLDLDGVVADYETTMRKITSAITGVAEAAIPVASTWSLVESGWPFSDEQDFLRVHHEAVNEHSLYQRIQPINGASEALWRLSDAGVHIRVVTHRLVTNFSHGKVVSDTVAWLDQHRVPYRDICFVKDKADIFGCDMFVDDSPGNITAIRERHGPQAAVIYDQPYNQHLPAPRVANWDELIAVVEQRSGTTIP